MKPMDTNFLHRLRLRLWDERELVNRSERQLVALGRYAYALVRDLLEGQLSMRAMSLVYTTLLSVVPMLALGFSVLKALGAHNSLEPVLMEFLRPLGPQGAELTRNIIGFVEKVQVGVLGSVGVALLFYTAISLIQKVESSFNFIWRIERVRPITQRIGEYLGLLMVGPVVVFSAIGLTATVRNSAFVTNITSIEPFGVIIYALTRIAPYVLIVGMFTFMYAYMPNTRVRIRAAACGGLTAGVLWQTSSLAFASFVAGATNYNAIYSSFAILIFLLIWIHVGWLILLIGCQLSFYVQHPEHLKLHRTVPALAGRHAEYLALMIMSTAGRRFIAGEPGLTQEEFAKHFQAEPAHVARAVETLIQSGYLVEAGRTRTQLVPGRDLDSFTLGEIWRAVRADINDTQQRDALGRNVAVLLDQAEQQFAAGAGKLSLREWLKSEAAR